MNDVVPDSDSAARGEPATAPPGGPAQAPPQPAARARRRPLAARVMRWGVAVILVGVLVNLAMAAQSVGSGAVAAVTEVRPLWLVVAALLGMAPNLFHALRILVWVRFLGRSASFRQCLRAAFGTELGSSVSPKAIGGAPVKIGLLMEAGENAGTAASIALLTNFDDMLVYVLVMPVVVVLTRAWEIPHVEDTVRGVATSALAGLPWALGALALLGGALWWRRRRARLGDPTAAAAERPGPRGAIARARRDFFAAWALVGRRGKGRFVLSVLLTTMQWMCRWSVATAVLWGLGYRVDPLLFLMLQWVVYSMMLFVPTPGAALGAEASFAAVLGPFVPPGLLGLVGAAWRFFTFYLVLLVGLVAVPALGAAAKPRVAAIE